MDGKPHIDVVSWKSALDELSAWQGATVYGGRGEPAPVDVAVAEEKQYLDAIDALARDYVREIGGAKPDFKVFAQRASVAFPGYALPYMIEYGAYGLVGERQRAR